MVQKEITLFSFSEIDNMDAVLVMKKEKSFGKKVFSWGTDLVIDKKVSEVEKEGKVTQSLVSRIDATRHCEGEDHKKVYQRS